MLVGLLHIQIEGNLMLEREEGAVAAAATATAAADFVAMVQPLRG